MSVSESFKKKYLLSGDTYSAQNADRAISDLIACITRLHSDVGAASARAESAEKQVEAVKAENKKLLSENENLGNELLRLRDANTRLTADAEMFDKKLADVRATVNANDRKLAEASERLSALIARAEQLCTEIDERTEVLCKNIDERIGAVGSTSATSDNCRSGENESASSATDETEETAVTAAVEEGPASADGEVADEAAEDIPELEEIGDDELSENDTDSDPNLSEDADEIVENDENIETISEETNMLEALKQALAGSGRQKKTPATEEKKSDPDIAVTDTAGETADVTEASVSSDEKPADEKAPEPAHEPSFSDDDIKNMLTAMYSDKESSDVGTHEDDTPAAGADAEDDTEKAETSAADTATQPEAAPAQSGEHSGYGSMKNSLEAIRRRLGK